MNNTTIHFIISLGERLVTECKETAHKTILVRGHFRMVNGRKVYVKTHYRKK